MSAAGYPGRPRRAAQGARHQAGLTQMPFSVAPGGEPSWGGDRPRIRAQGRAGRPEALPRGQQACGRQELGLVGEGRRMKGWISD